MIKCSCSIDEHRAKLLRTGGVFHLILNALNQSIAYYNTTQTFETVLKQSLCRYIVGFYCKDYLNLRTEFKKYGGLHNI